MATRGALVAEGPLGNALPSSSHPPPSAIKKPKGLGRPSMIPQAAHRLSVMPPAPPMLSHSSSQEQLRRSTLGQSGTRGDGGMFGRTPQSKAMGGSMRRSSAYPVTARPSMAPATSFGASLQREIRPVRDRNFQQSCQHNIQEYLNNARCPLPITGKCLISPTTKEFQTIFKFLVQDFADASSWAGKKWEDDALNILKDLKYPVMEGIRQTALGSPGAPNHWVILLPMLNWLVELNKAHDRWTDPEVIADPLLQTAEELPFDHVHFEDRLFWGYAVKTYSLWYQGVEEGSWVETDMEFEAMYDRLAQASLQEGEELALEVQKREAELKQLQVTEPPLRRLEEEYIQLVGDQTKFIAFLGQYQQKAEKLRVAIDRFRTKTADFDAQIQAARAELARTEEAVAAQNLWPDEVQRMNHERESLTRNLDELRVKIAEANQMAYDQELQVTKSMDRFESLVTEYNALAQQIGTMPADGTSAVGPDGVDYNVDLDLGVEDLSILTNDGKRLQEKIKPALQAFGEKFLSEATELGVQKIAMDNELDKKIQEVEGMKDEAAVRQAKLSVLSEKAEEARLALQKATASENEMNRRIENEVAICMEDNEQKSYKEQDALAEVRFQYDELRHKTTKLQESMTAEVSRHVETIIRAKEHTSNCLQGLRSFAESH